MNINNNNPFTKNIKNVHFLFKDEIPFSLREVLKNSFSGIDIVDTYLKISVLPDNVKIISEPKTTKSGFYWSHKISLNINEQNEVIRKTLDFYQNTLVVACLETTAETINIYGNKDQPLIFSYRDEENTDNIELIGHEITVKGDTYTSYKAIPASDFYSPTWLAAWLATPI